MEREHRRYRWENVAGGTLAFGLVGSAGMAIGLVRKNSGPTSVPVGFAQIMPFGLGSAMGGALFMAVREVGYAYGDPNQRQTYGFMAGMITGFICAGSMLGHKKAPLGAVTGGIFGLATDGVEAAMHKISIKDGQEEEEEEQVPKKRWRDYIPSARYRDPNTPAYDPYGLSSIPPDELERKYAEFRHKLYLVEREKQQQQQQQQTEETEETQTTTTTATTLDKKESSLV